MNENLAGSDVQVNIIQCRVYNLCRYVIDIVYVNEIEDQAAGPSSDKIFGVVFRCGPPGVAQRLPVVGFFASVNDKPSALAANGGFIGLRADKQILMHFNDECLPK